MAIETIGPRLYKTGTLRTSGAHMTLKGLQGPL